ncbi:LysR family transcriptional regulator [Pseudidiomarina sp.]|uniref:LysR family transcriptional regulator n=1 Tax=Pseudidiomarina sp. TaxID=2081707 RepID=UPI00299F062B|nr:LysR family transcriptional regulator [Pseudidiomarina sp.]MDX1706549.1 LysR family transcriptional regulator [Pseudidiomarina sp.]
MKLERLSDMAIYAKVVEAGSFSAAAEALDISKGAVSKAIARLEKHLNLRLLQRTTRRMTVTLEGRAFYDYCEQIVSQAAAAEHHLGSLRDEPSGIVRITAPVTFGSIQVAPLLPELLKTYPELKTELVLDDKRVDMVKENIDLALRCGVLEPNSLIARRLNDLPLTMVATPDYLKQQGTPEAPADLSQHQCLLHGFHAAESRWQLYEQGRPVSVAVTGPFCANNNLALKHALLAHMGIAFLPRYQVAAELAAGKLTELLADFVPAATPVHLVYRSRLHMSAAMKVTMEFLRARL